VVCVHFRCHLDSPGPSLHAFPYSKGPGLPTSCNHFSRSFFFPLPFWFKSPQFPLQGFCFISFIVVIPRFSHVHSSCFSSSRCFKHRLYTFLSFIHRSFARFTDNIKYFARELQLDISSGLKYVVGSSLFIK
jgi:hypothetical protein